MSSEYKGQMPMTLYTEYLCPFQPMNYSFGGIPAHIYNGNKAYQDLR